MKRQRKTLTPGEDALKHIVACRDKPFLEERFIDTFKGRGVFTHKAIEASSFVVEYRGNIFCKDRVPKKKCGDTLNNYLFEFSWKGAHWCVDASKEDRTLGRLVNDDHISPNCEMKKIVCEGKPHLCLFAIKEISRGEEITYNYGDSSYPWRSAESCAGSSTSYTNILDTPSTPRNEKNSDSSFTSEDSCSDEDDELSESEPSHEYPRRNSRPAVRDISPLTDWDSSGTSVPQPDNTSCTQQEDEAAFSSDELDSDEDYTPSRSVKPKDTSFARKNYCYVCGEANAKIARHLRRHAREEPDIAKAFALPKKSKERKKILNNLRNRGNYKHNQEVLRSNRGQLKLKRRTTTTEANAKTHMYCLYCKGMFKRKEVWRHVARCPSRPMLTSTKGGKTRVLSEADLAESSSPMKLSSGVWKILLTMKQDETAFAVRNDFLLLQLGQYLIEKYVNNANKQDFVRQKLREMGRLLLVLHEKSIFSFEDAIKPENFYKVVEAVKDMAGFDEKMQSYNKPSLALKLGHSLKKVGVIVLTRLDGSEQMMRDTKTFMKLCAEEWSELITQAAVASLRGRKVNNPSTIPFTRDVQVFYRYLERTSGSATECLNTLENPQAYSALCRVTLAQMSVLNKCSTEVSKMTLKTFQERGDTTQVLSKHFIRINILGRTGQNVAVLLTSELVSAIKLLVSKREACGVHPDNPFLFAKPKSATSLYHGGNCVRAFSRLCRAKNPEHLRSVHLYKHIARIFQILTLENNELNHLAKLLGRNIRADRDYYRLPKAAVELAKIARLLLAMEKGSLEAFKGNSLEEIEVEDELEPDVEQGSSETSDIEEDNEDSDLLPQQSDDVEEQQLRQPSPEQDALEHIKARRDKHFLEEMFIDPFKGRGVFTREAIEPSAFVVEYRGNIFSRKETTGKKSGDTLSNYLFDFVWKGQNWCVDASKEDGTLGRLVNDDHVSPNCTMKKIACEGKPHLCLFAVKKISPGEEITYSYGHASYPWRSAKASEDVKTSQTDRNSAASSSEDASDEDSAGPSSSAGTDCDNEYVPDGGPSSDEGSAGGSKQHSENLKSNPDRDLSEQPEFTQQPADASCTQQEDSSDDFTSDGETEDHPRRRNTNYCYVCGKAQTKISRHLFTHRKEEPDIAVAFASPLHSKERSRLLDDLRNRGNIKHNEKVLKTRCGELKVKRRKSNVSSTVQTFAACLYCKGMYSRRVLGRHMSKCSSEKSSKRPSRRESRVLTLVAAAESTDPKEISSGLSNVFEKLKRDEVGRVVLTDSLILLLAQCMSHTNDGKTRNSENITHKLRILGRLLLALRGKSVCSFEEAIRPENFSKVVEAVRELTGFSEEMKSCKRPSLIKTLGNLLKKIGDINFARALRENADKERIQDAEAFRNSCAKEWKAAPQSSLSSPQTISFTQDVQLLYQYMEKIAASAVQSLRMYESPQVYTALIRVTVAQVLLLNKNMGEVSEVTLKSFRERDETEPREDAEVCQSQFEQILSERYVKINVMTNRGKKVAVTLTPELLTATTLLVDKREACGVHENNPFLFARAAPTRAGFFRGLQCVRIFADRCGAKSPMNLKSADLQQHIAKLCQILSLSSEQLDQLAKLLRRDIRTDTEYYQTPEAAADIAKISELLSALENGSLERFEGKSLEEIEIADNLQLDVEKNDADNEESGCSFELSGLLSFSSSKKTSRASRVSSSKKRGRGRNKRRESECEAFEQSDERLDDEMNAEMDDRAEEAPVSRAASTPKDTLSRSNEDATLYFSDDDEDMHVDFDIDVDTDDDSVRNEEEDRDEGTPGPPVTPDLKDVTEQDDDGGDAENDEGSPDRREAAEDADETSMDLDTENHVEEGDQQRGEELNTLMDVDSRSSSPILKTEKKNKLSAAIAGMKEVKILIPRLDIAKLKTPIRISGLSTLCNVIQRPEKDQHTNDNQRPTSSKDTEHTPSSEKEVQMTCSHCQKSMTKGQTAYQKKGFTDVFCSKNCLFETFPVIRPVTKTCHCCRKVISQPVDLIMAAVDLKGTMKDFCSVTCLSTFKSPKPPSVCAKCKETCTTACELTLHETVHTFCSSSCQRDFRKDNTIVCDNCSSAIQHQPLTLRLEGEETKTICGEDCLNELKENTLGSHQCTMCNAVRSISDMFYCKSDKDIVELFCSRTCVTSYKLRPTTVCKSQGENDNNKRKRGTRSEQQSDTDQSRNITPTLIIANSCVTCSNCGTKLPRGQTIYKPPNSPEVFCSVPCLSERHPHIKSVEKKCYNCLKVIERPHKIILAPVDDSGNMRELCSNSCLSSVQSRTSTAPRPPLQSRSACTMCSRFLVCKFKLILDGLTYKICDNACLVNYQKVNKLSMFPCEVCSCFSVKDWFQLRMEGGNKTICSEECLTKFKEKTDTPRLCLMCQTTHQMSDMVESKNDEGVLDFFCSNRCVMVHKAQSSAAPGSSRLSVEENDIKEVKPRPALDYIKKESTNDEYNQNLPSSISTENIKNEPNVSKDLKIGSVFSLKGGSAASAALALAHMDLPASCSNCKTILMDGGTVYQRKSRADIFCSTSCLMTFYQMKQVKKTCGYCLQPMTESQHVLQAPVDTEGAVKDFCSQTCLSSFSYKKIISTKIPIMPLTSQSQCSMCSRYCISKHEVIQEDVIHKICSDPCFLRFSNLHKMSFCENCHSHCRAPLVLKMEDGSKRLCSAECLAQFKQKIKTPQPCAMCSTAHLMSEMFEKKNSEDAVELFCTSSCVMASKIQAVSASGIPLGCDKCGKIKVPACHLAMSDASIRNFCSLSCAMALKETQKDMSTASNASGTSDQTHYDFLKPPEKLPCAQCRRILKTTPRVVQKKGKMNFVCTLACSREFKRVNNIMGKCEYCKNERIIRDAKRVDGKDCYFCSDSCKMLFRHELEKKWGEHCHSCTYCRCISKTLVTAQYDGTKEVFCSEECNSKYNMLFCHLARCDTCGHEGKLRQSLPMLGEVKYFCDLKCVFHFCNKKVQMVNTVSSPPRSAGTAESSPVIANVVSLAGALAQQPHTSASSAQLVSVPDIQTKVVGHVSTQTVPKELKNKSMLCTPLVHNKGVSCTTQTVDAQSQTDKLEPRVIFLPVPVPMSMHGQGTAMPSPLRVSKLLPEPSAKSTKEPEFVERNETDDSQEDGAVTKEGHNQKIQPVTEHSTSNMPEDSFTDTRSQHAHSTPLETGTPTEPRADLPPPAPRPAVEDTDESPKVLPVSEAAEEETSQRDFSRKYHTLKSQRGIDSWNRWLQWLQSRESHTNLDLVSSQAATINQDVLKCSVTELCDGLCRFIAEVKRPDGEPYSPDSLFYICLCIQQYLFENGRLENIFSDQIYNKFSTEFTKILKGFKPSITSSGYIQSCVEEEFLWDCKQLGAYSPIVLLNTLLFFCCKYFGLTTVEQHRQLSFANVRCITRTKEDDTKTTVLHFYPPTSINQEESDADSVPAKRRKRSEKRRRVLEMTENSENPLRCPVSLYKFYLSKCSQSVRQRSDLFYLHPDRRRGASSPLWFHSIPVEESTMEAMLVRILAVRGLWEGSGTGLDQQTQAGVEG